MENTKIQPEKITKPIQLLAVWFAGLVLLVGLLLTGAKTITEPIWLVPVLAISAIAIIPIFLYFVFLLQTKYRPQMQEDTYYSKYIDTSTNKPEIVENQRKFNTTIADLQTQIIKLSESNKEYLKNIERLINTVQSTDSSKIKELEGYISNSKKNIEILEDSVMKNQFNIQLNTLLPNYNEFTKALINNGYDKFETFTGGDDKPLDKALLSIGLNVDPIYLSKFLNILIPNGIELIALIDDEHSIDYRRNDIVIGSHAYKFGRKTFSVNSELLGKIEKITSKKELHKLLS